MAFTVLSFREPDESDSFKQLRHLEERIVNVSCAELRHRSSLSSAAPGRSEFIERLADLVLTFIASGRTRTDSSTDVLKIDGLITSMLSSDLYEVRLKTLQFLHSSFKRVECLCGTDETVASFAANSRQKPANVINELTKDEVIFKTLITMATSQEKHPECLEKVSVYITVVFKFE